MGKLQAFLAIVLSGFKMVARVKNALAYFAQYEEVLKCQHLNVKTEYLGMSYRRRTMIVFFADGQTL